MADAAEAGKPQSQAEFILYTTLRIIGVLASIYMFLMGLDMMGSSFLVLGGKGDLFTIVDNPVTGVVLAISLLYGASIAGGIVVTLLALGVVAGFIAWWWMGGCYKVVSKEQREERAAEMAAEMGEKPAEGLVLGGRRGCRVGDFCL
ncbi:hypothetical protein AK812_SmicGene42329 [Symbiodinium microadriaticum]|uniref:Uncharacterized protein n=1 Tax=Symbiodinium microadriaticum TaxID=2951 RepID=A0A1Q9C3U9_SYMMI|nr:hypothetical protein AK812_SmicGene42329 [Symbiodinium microadriaticum]